MTAQMTIGMAIRKVLHEADGPLGATAIAEVVVPLVPGLKGKTPKATVTATIYTQAKREDGYVQKVDGGFVLREQAATPADDGPAVIPGSKVVRDGGKATSTSRRKTTATA